MTEPASEPADLTAKALREARAGRRHAALALLDRALAAAPDAVQARYLRGLLRLEAGDPGGASEDLERAAASLPDAAPVAAALGSARLRAGDPVGADAALRRSLLLLPAQPDALASHSGCLIAGLAFAPGERSAARALLLAPGHPQAIGNRAEALHHLGRPEAALAALDTHATRGDAAPQLRLNRAVTLLGLERWSEGWPAYEARLDPTIPDHIRRRHRLPRWSAEAAGRPVAVLAEQGIGEQILFLRFLPALAARAPVVAGELDGKLHPLVRRSHPALPLVAARRFRDVHGPLADERAVIATAAATAVEIASLPAVLGSPSPAGAEAPPYLAADPDRVGALRTALAEPAHRLVGVCWRSKNAAFGGFKSTRLVDWAPILRVPGVTFVNLQYGDVAAEIAEAGQAAGREVLTSDVDLFDDLDGAAALIAAMDLVITTGSTTAQLAGALGVPTWVLLSRGPGLMWYWGHGERTPWYPTMRLFRQTAPGDWLAPVAAVAAALADAP
ncbi:hypothetical protein [Thalassobaculum sp.]|uniref:hypothetical protein n=1 Tax=Thalassobaculum sp. TaxID=2022740 RepID=UPI0032F05371